MGRIVDGCPLKPRYTYLKNTVLHECVSCEKVKDCRLIEIERELFEEIEIYQKAMAKMTRERNNYLEAMELYDSALEEELTRIEQIRKLVE